MKTILLGYATEDDKGKATLLAGPEIPVNEQAAMIGKIKTTNTYPDGLVRVDLFELRPRETGIYIPTKPTSKPSKKGKDA